MSFLTADYFIHAANVLLLVAYCVRDILWLRLFAVAASVIAIPFYVMQPVTLWAPLGWSVVFASINLFQSWLLFIERRPVQLTRDEEQVRRLVFKGLPPRKVLQVLNVGSWTHVAAGEQLLERGKVPDSVLLIVNGKVEVSQDGHTLLQLVPGDIVGSALILNSIPADVDAVTIVPLKAVRWHVETLVKYLSANPDTRAAMQRHLARDLAGKLERVVRETPHPAT